MYMNKNNDILLKQLIYYNLMYVRRHSAFEYTMRQKNAVMMQAPKAYCIMQER